MHAWCLIIISALLVPIAYIEPITLWWVSFLVPTFLYSAVIQYRLTWLHGYVWMALALTMHGVGVLWGLYTLAAGAVWLKLLFVVCMVLVTSIWGGLCFAVAAWCSKLIVEGSLLLRLIVWTGGLWCLYMGIAAYVFSVMGARGGYWLFNPLLPLVTQEFFVELLTYFGTSFLLVIFLAFAAGMAYIAVLRTRMLPHVIMCCVGVWLLGSWFVKHELPVQKFTGIGVLQQQFTISNNMQEQVSKLRECLVHMHEKCCIIAPEACVYDHHFFAVPSIYKRWATAVHGQIIIGGFRWVGAAYCNSLFLIQEGVVKAVFDKRDVVPMLEYAPGWMVGDWLQKLYFQVAPMRSGGKNMRPLWRLGNGVLVVPYICSELLLQKNYDDPFPGVMLLAVCNDAWAPPVTQRMMLLAARYQAVAWQRDILYVSYKHSVFINKRGACYDYYH